MSITAQLCLRQHARDKDMRGVHGAAFPVHPTEVGSKCLSLLRMHFHRRTVHTKILRGIAA